MNGTMRINEELLWDVIREAPRSFVHEALLSVLRARVANGENIRVIVGPNLHGLCLIAGALRW